MQRHRGLVERCEVLSKQEGIESDDSHESDQAEFFSDDGTNEVGPRFKKWSFAIELQTWPQTLLSAWQSNFE